MHFVTQQRQQQQQQQPTQQPQQQAQQQKTSYSTLTAGTRFVSLRKSSSQGALPKSLTTAQNLNRQTSQQQQQQQKHKRTASLNLQTTSMRDSISEDILITTTTTSSKLITIQEAVSSLEQQQQQQNTNSNSSSNPTASSSSTASASPVNPNSSSTNSNGNHATPPLAPPSPKSTPSIHIAPATDAHSACLDSNGFNQGASSTDSPSSRKSSTSSKGKPDKLNRDEDTLSKLSETENHFVRGDPTQQVGSSNSSLEKPARSTSRLSERAKKKSWYNVIYPNYKSRAEDFKKLFKDVPNEERLIVDYSCALQRDILVQGRLYVSQNYVCFHANIFTWETYVSIKWKDVTAITKEKTALVIPNAISIATAKDKYFFATFASRDKSFLMLFRVWQNTLMNKLFSPQEIWRHVHSCYGDELGLTTDDEDYIDPTLDADTETDVDFQTAIDDLGGEQSNSSQSISNQQLPQQSGNSSASSGGGSNTAAAAAATRKSKTKYFFNSSKSSNLNSSANASAASGSDNKASDSNRKSNKKMKANAKELTLSSVKPAEQSVAVTLSAPSSATATTTVAAAAATAAAAAPAPEKKLENSSNNQTPAEPHHGAETKRKHSKLNQRQREAELPSKNSEAVPTDVSDSSDSEANNVPFVPSTECTSTHEGRQIVHTILPIKVDTLFNFLFSKSKFLTEFHDSRKSTDLTAGEWKKNDEGQNVRQVSVTVQLAASVGPKTSKVTEYQTMRDCSKPGELYSIDVNSVNAGIPYADSFSVLIHFCLARTVDDHTMLSIHAQIKYKKSIWGVVKGFIEKNTWAGLEDFFGAQLHALQSETCIPPAKGKGRRPRRGLKSNQLVTTTTATSTDNDCSSVKHHHQHHHQHRHHHSHSHLQQQSQSSSPHHAKSHQQQQQQQQPICQHRKAKLHTCKGTATQIRPMEEPLGNTTQTCMPDTLDSWDNKLLSGAGGVAGAAAGLAADSAKQQKQKQQQQLLAGAQQLGMDLGQSQHGYKHKSLSLAVVVLMFVLLALNVILLIKLWKLEERIDVDLSRRARMPSLATLKELPNTNQDWLELMRQQELSHESELHKWHQVLQTAIELLKKVSIVCEKVYSDDRLRQSIEDLHTEL
ncbi:protein Aster-B isoform X3 [Drosophila busckii]|uniref:protein Aster-B isoform X3 n=1 Tax=Drosophila busckii TaxID=30019 RepID=UPI00083EF5E9|nr:protein Aster-B isoform X3 [Drosophila busckii]